MKVNFNEKYTLVDREIICKEYAPDVFAHLRELDGIDNIMLKKSLNPAIKKNVEKIKKAGEGMGKSGSFFFFSHDTKFLIKTMTTDDFDAFMSLFRAYFEHINVEKNSLIARIYGVYSVQMDDMNTVYLILMGNTKPIEDKYIKKTYDLKGSMVKRIVKGDEKDFKNNAVLKDKNILHLQDEEIILKFSEKDKKGIIDRMAKDVSLLSLFNLMDYSLLFTIAYNPNFVEHNPDLFQSKDGKLIEPYSLKKKEKARLSL